MKYNNNKGFTLAELLAVIVVLAIIIVLLMPGVMNTMETSREKGFRMFAQRVTNAAREQFNVDEVMELTKSPSMCYDLTKLGLANHGSYVGIVKITVNANLQATKFEITLTDRSYSVANLDVTTIDDVTLADPITDTATIKCP